METTCGFCGGTGCVARPPHDAYGYRPDLAGEQTCEYCDGAGVCEDGNMLEQQRPVSQASDEDRQRAGNPPWA